MSLETEVANLTTQTTALLDAVNVSKATLDQKAAEASNSAASALAIYGDTAAMNAAVTQTQSFFNRIYLGGF